MPGDVSGHVKLAKRKRGDQWYVKYRLPSGKQVEKRLGPAWNGRGPRPPGHHSRKSAEAELAAILTDARRGALPDPGARSGRTLGDAVAEWLRYTEQERGRRRSTLRDYRNAASGALLPEFGVETPLEEITAERIDSYRSRLLTESTVSRRTTHKLMVLMHGIFRRARYLGWVRENPLDTVERVSVASSGEFNVLTIQQIETIAARAEGMFAAAITVAAYTGLRTGELRALRWRDVDLAAATLHVRRNRPVGGKEDLPKSGRVRSVPLMDDAARALDALSRRNGPTAPDDRVFPSEAGGVLSEDALRKALYIAMEAAGIDRKSFPAKNGFTFHDLRHTFGTLAVRVFPLVDVQAYMGHADIQTTMRYAHHVPKRDAARFFTEAIERERAESVEIAAVG